MERKTYAATPQEALVRILGPSGEPVGTGCLTLGGLIVTCAHVVRAVLGLKREQMTGTLPRGRIPLDFPFPPGWRDRTDPIIPQTFEAEVAPGGWGWMDRVWHGNDIAILRLFGDAPFACGRMFSSLDHAEQDIPAFVQGFRARDTDAGAVKGTLMAQIGLSDGRRIFDCANAAYKFDFGFSGAPLFSSHDAAAGIFIGDPSYEDGSVREPHRVAYVLPARRVTALIDAVLQSTAPPPAPEALTAACSYIPVMKASFDQLVQAHNSAAPFVGGVSGILRQLEIIAAEPLDDANMTCFLDIIGDLKRQEGMAKARGWDQYLTLFGLSDFCHALGAFGEKLRPADQDGGEASTVPNDLLEEGKLPHWSQLQAVKKAVGERLDALAGQTLPVSPELRRRVRNTLFRLSRQLDLDPLYLSVINAVRADLEALDRSLFQALIAQCQTLIGVYSEKLPDFAVFRDFPEGPEMIVIPAGRFVMGSPEEERSGTIARVPNIR